jgi:hypothetical protein
MLHLHWIYWAKNYVTFFEKSDIELYKFLKFIIIHIS